MLNNPLYIQETILCLGSKTNCQNVIKRFCSRVTCAQKQFFFFSTPEAVPPAGGKLAVGTACDILAKPLASFQHRCLVSQRACSLPLQIPPPSFLFCFRDSNATSFSGLRLHTAAAWTRPGGAAVRRLLRGAAGRRRPGAGLGRRSGGERRRQAEAASARHPGAPRHARNPLALLPPPTPTPTRLGKGARLHPQAPRRSVLLLQGSALYI